jgi:hypothetical protein
MTKTTLLGIMLVGFLFGLFVTGAAIANPPNIAYRDVRALGMGGVGVTTMRGFAATMYNPASLAHTKFDLDLVSIQGTVGKDVADLLQFLDDNEDVLDNWDSSSEEQRDDVRKNMSPFEDNWMGVGVYPQIGVVSNGLAVGLYGAGNIDFKADEGILEPRVYTRGIADYALTAAYAKELRTNFVPHRLYLGAAVKVFRRYQTTLLNMTASDFDVDQAFDTLVKHTAVSWGFDAGLLYELSAKVDFGMKVTDLIGNIDGERPSTIFNIGVGYYPSDRLKLAVDINDLFFTRGESFFNRFFAGGEYRVYDWLPIRAGLGQGHPSAGLGLYVGVVEIDGAVYGTEYGNTPGDDSDYSYAFRFKLGL